METFKAVCSNPWCKATFTYTEDDMTLVKKERKPFQAASDVEYDKIPPKVCHKCKSFDTELSGGVTWEDKKYEGDRFSGPARELKYKVTYNR